MTVACCAGLRCLQRRLVGNNACEFSVDPAGCTSVFFGVMTRGLQPAMQLYAHTAMGLLSKRAAQTFVADSAAAVAAAQVCVLASSCSQAEKWGLL